MSIDQRVLFGTDGIRGLANQYPMNGEMVMKLGRALGHQLKIRLGRRPKVLIGKDTRLSGYLFETALAGGLVSVGSDVHLVGPLPTPGIAFLTTGMRCDAGVVISASHNPYQDNGIKLFARDGFKLPDAEELALEKLILGDALDSVRATGADVGRAYRIHDAAGRYSVFAKGAQVKDWLLEKGVQAKDWALEKGGEAKDWGGEKGGQVKDWASEKTASVRSWISGFLQPILIDIIEIDGLRWYVFTIFLCVVLLCLRTSFC